MRAFFAAELELHTYACSSDRTVAEMSLCCIGDSSIENADLESVLPSCTGRWQKRTAVHVFLFFLRGLVVDTFIDICGLGSAYQRSSAMIEDLDPCGNHNAEKVSTINKVGNTSIE
jgi:hypothetical protein